MGDIWFDIYAELSHGIKHSFTKPQVSPITVSVKICLSGY